MMELPASVLEKIRSDDLRHEAMAETSESRSVIVELDLPMPKLEMTESRGAGSTGRSRLRFAPMAREDEAEAGRKASKIEALKEGIATITGHLPETYLSASESFVVNANGEQIGRIACMPTVSAIWPNSRRGR